MKRGERYRITSQGELEEGARTASSARSCTGAAVMLYSTNQVMLDTHR